MGKTGMGAVSRLRSGKYDVAENETMVLTLQLPETYREQNLMIRFFPSRISVVLCGWKTPDRI